MQHPGTKLACKHLQFICAYMEQPIWNTNAHTHIHTPAHVLPSTETLAVRGGLLQKIMVFVHASTLELTHTHTPTNLHTCCHPKRPLQ